MFIASLCYNIKRPESNISAEASQFGELCVLKVGTQIEIIINGVYIIVIANYYHATFNRKRQISSHVDKKNFHAGLTGVNDSFCI